MRILALSLFVLFSVTSFSKSSVYNKKTLRKITILDIADSNPEKVLSMTTKYQSSYGTIYEVTPVEEGFQLSQKERFYSSSLQLVLESKLDREMNVDISPEDAVNDSYRFRPTKERKNLKVLTNDDVEGFIENVTDLSKSELSMVTLGYTPSYLAEHKYELSQATTRRYNEATINSLFDDVTKFDQLLPKYFNRNNSYVNNRCFVELVFETDTITFWSEGGLGYYLLPWVYADGRKSYNSSISKFLASLITYDEYSSKNALSSHNFERGLMNFAHISMGQNTYPIPDVKFIKYNDDELDNYLSELKVKYSYAIVNDFSEYAETENVSVPVYSIPEAKEYVSSVPKLIEKRSEYTELQKKHVDFCKEHNEKYKWAKENRASISKKEYDEAIGEAFNQLKSQYPIAYAESYNAYRGSLNESNLTILHYLIAVYSEAGKEFPIAWIPEKSLNTIKKNTKIKQIYYAISAIEREQARRIIGE